FLQTGAQVLERSGRLRALGQNRELIAAQAGNAHIRVAEPFAQTPTNFLQHPVTGGVAEGVVDVLEAVQVEEEYRKRLPGRSRDRLVELAHEAVAVLETRERIVLREVLLLGDIGRLPPQRAMQLPGECQYREHPDQEHRRGAAASLSHCRRSEAIGTLAPT